MLKKILDPNSISLTLKTEISNTLNEIFKDNECTKILLINPPDGDEKMFNYKTAKTGRYTNFAPYGLGIISKYLASIGYDVKILNLNHEILKKVKELDEEDFNYEKILNEKKKKS